MGTKNNNYDILYIISVIAIDLILVAISNTLLINVIVSITFFVLLLYAIKVFGNG